MLRLAALTFGLVVATGLLSILPQLGAVGMLLAAMPLFLTLLGQAVFVGLGRDIDEKAAPALLVFAALAPQALYVSQGYVRDEWRYILVFVAFGLTVLGLMLLGIALVLAFFPRVLAGAAWAFAGLTILLVIMPVDPPAAIAARLLGPSILTVPTLPVVAQLSPGGRVKVHGVTYRQDRFRLWDRGDVCQIVASTEGGREDVLATHPCKTRLVRCDEEHAFCVVDAEVDAAGLRYDGSPIRLERRVPLGGDPVYLRAGAQILALVAAWLLLQSKKPGTRVLALRTSALAATVVGSAFVLPRIVSWLY